MTLEKCRASSLTLHIVENHWIIYSQPYINTGLPWWLSGKEPTCQCRRHRLDPRVRKMHKRRKWQPLHYTWLGNSIDRGGWCSWGRKRVRHSLAARQQQYINMWFLPIPSSIFMEFSSNPRSWSTVKWGEC